MDLELRAVRDDEMGALGVAAGIAFGQVEWRFDEFPIHLLTSDRSLAVFDEAAIVANAGAFSFQLTVPGGAAVDVAGVTIVGVRPTHRRRGLLRWMMDEQLDDVARRGEALAVLTASEASIYERFGYGIATLSAKWELPSEHTTFTTPAPTLGTVRLVEADKAIAAAAAVFEAAAKVRVGEIRRPPAWWEPVFSSPPEGSDQKPARFFTALHHAPDGAPDAFARYAIDEHWPDGVPSNVLRVLEIQAIHPTAEAALWEYLFAIDLVGTVRAVDRPVDDPLRWRLRDPRRMRVGQLRDHLWVRVVDVAAAMGARTYAVDDALVVELVDGFRPANSGRWRIEGGPDGATCARTDREPDLAVSAADLGSLYLGGVAASTLAAAGRVGERTAGAVRRADRFFGIQPSPWCTTHF